jgi:hypothetical protein
LVVLCAGSALLLAEDESTSIVKRRPCWSVIKPVCITFSRHCLLFSWTINLGFLTEGKQAAILIIPSSWGSQRAGHSPCTRTSDLPHQLGVSMPQVISKLSLVLHFLIWATEGPRKNRPLSAVQFWQISATICVCLSIAFFLSSFDHETFGEVSTVVYALYVVFWVETWTKRVDSLLCLC